MQHGMLSTLLSLRRFLRREKGLSKNNMFLYLDVSSELLEEGEGVLRHGVDFGALPIAGLTTAGGGAHLCPAFVVGQRCLVHVAAGRRPSRRAPAVLVKRWSAGQSACCNTSSVVN